MTQPRHHRARPVPAKPRPLTAPPRRYQPHRRLDPDRRTQISGMRTALIAGAAGLTAVMIFIIQKARRRH
jgi:hypothetical protein